MHRPQILVFDELMTQWLLKLLHPNHLQHDEIFSFLPSCTWPAIRREQQLLPSVIPSTSCPSARQLRLHIQGDFHPQIKSVTGPWWEVMTGGELLCLVNWKSKVSFASWLYGSIINNPVDPRWHMSFVMILRVGLIVRSLPILALI